MAKSTKSTNVTGECRCYAAFAYEVTQADIPESEAFEPYDVYQMCGEKTERTFAPGHDAKLKSVLIKCYRAGQDYSYTEGGALIHVSPMVRATALGWAHFLTDAKPKVKRAAKPKADKRDAAEKARQRGHEHDGEEFQPVEHAGFHPVRVKIGRWVYDANLDAEDVNSVTVSYQDKKGQTNTATIKRSALVN